MTKTDMKTITIMVIAGVLTVYAVEYLRGQNS